MYRIAAVNPSISHIFSCGRRDCGAYSGDDPQPAFRNMFRLIWEAFTLPDREVARHHIVSSNSIGQPAYKQLSQRKATTGTEWQRAHAWHFMLLCPEIRDAALAYSTFESMSCPN